MGDTNSRVWLMWYHTGAHSDVLPSTPVPTDRLVHSESLVDSLPPQSTVYDSGSDQFDASHPFPDRDRSTSCP